MRKPGLVVLPLMLLAFQFCSDHSTPPRSAGSLAQKNSPTLPSNKPGVKTIHVFVALCDNKYQGIVPVGKTIGNGQDSENNLYWGAAYGVKAFFTRKNSDWQLISQSKDTGLVLDRLLLKHKRNNVYLLAEAYDGKFIKETTIDFINATAGRGRQLYKMKNDSIYFGGASNLICYVGHDGLMDFNISPAEQPVDSSKREAIILACYSKSYFSSHLAITKANPLLWTTGLMAPEAYILHNAFNAWVNNENQKNIQRSAAEAYSKYQHCSPGAARKLFDL